MAKRVVVIGGVALGPKVGARLMRCAPKDEVILLDKDRNISYGGCGIPYYVGGDVSELEELRKTMYHMVRDEAFFRDVKHFETRTGKEVLSIDRSNKRVVYRDVDDGTEESLEYDDLVIATGATPVLPPLPGTDLPGVFVVSNLHDAERIKGMLSSGQLESAVVVGGGAIGIEMAEALTDLWGAETSLVEMMDQVLPAAVTPVTARMMEKHLRDNEIPVYTGTKVNRVLGDEDSGVQAVETSQGQIPCQAVIFSVGVRPNSYLAEQAGLALGPNKGVLVNRRLMTSDPHIYAGGDCIEQRHLVSGDYMILPLGSLANRQGRVIANNIAGCMDHFSGVVSNFCVKVFDHGLARAGLTYEQARQAGFTPMTAFVVQPDRAHFYPDSALMFMKLIADARTRRVLGVEAYGPKLDAVKARVDAIAPLISSREDLSEISNLEVCYSPPFSSAMDIVNVAGNSMQNVLDGIMLSVEPQDFVELFHSTDCNVLDPRSEAMAGPCVEKYGSRWINIPLSQVPYRLQEIPGDKPLYVFCNTGTTSFEVQRYLNSMGYTDVWTVVGSYAAMLNIDPEFVS
ncbi:MAG: FAD-dependent oxidoreductase [Desulfohalobiaceae bacterium]